METSLGRDEFERLARVRSLSILGRIESAGFLAGVAFGFSGFGAFSGTGSCFGTGGG